MQCHWNATRLKWVFQWLHEIKKIFSLISSKPKMYFIANEKIKWIFFEQIKMNVFFSTNIKNPSCIRSFSESAELNIWTGNFTTSITNRIFYCLQIRMGANKLKLTISIFGKENEKMQLDFFVAKFVYKVSILDASKWRYNLWAHSVHKV